MMGFKTIFKWVILIYQATIVSCAQPPNIIFILADDLVSRRLLCVFMLVTYTFFTENMTIKHILQLPICTIINMFKRRPTTMVQIFFYM